MEVVDGMHAGQILGGCSLFVRFWKTSRVRDNTLMTHDHAAFQVRRTVAEQAEAEADVEQTGVLLL